MSLISNVYSNSNRKTIIIWNIYYNPIFSSWLRTTNSFPKSEKRKKREKKMINLMMMDQSEHRSVYTCDDNAGNWKLGRSGRSGAQHGHAAAERPGARVRRARRHGPPAAIAERGRVARHGPFLLRRAERAGPEHLLGARPRLPQRYELAVIL